MISKYGQIQRLFRACYQLLLDIEIAHCHNHFLFDTNLILACRNLHHVQVIARHIIPAFADTPIQ